jgi:flagellar basal body rod protein FlgB
MSEIFKVNEMGFDPTYNNLTQAMERSAKIQSVIAQNIANANNPKYEAMEFDKELDKAVKRKNKTVILEEEMASLASNSGAHSAYVRMLTAKLGVLRSIVTQGRK